MLVGLITVCVVSTLALVQLIAAYRKYKRHREYFALSNGGGITNGLLHDAAASDQPRVLVANLVFHFLVFLCLVLEVPVFVFRYLSIFYGGVDVAPWLYALHLFSYLSLFTAFCVIATLWGDLAVFEPNRWTKLMNRRELLPIRLPSC